MAFIGMRHPVVAKMSEHTPGTEPTYTGGRVIGHAITGNLTITRNNNPLYGDDVIVEDDNGITAMSLDLGVDDVDEEVRVFAMALKEKKASGSGGVTEYIDTDASAPYMGAGYIRVRRKGGKTTYQAVWIYKGIFSQESEESKTKGESVEWGTPVIRVRAMGIDVDGSGERAFRKKVNFDTEEAAVTWLDKMANIMAKVMNNTPGGTPVATASTK